MSSEFTEAMELIQKLRIFQIRGRDKRGRKIFRIIGKFFLGNNLVEFINVFVDFRAFFLLNFNSVFFAVCVISEDCQC